MSKQKKVKMVPCVALHDLSYLDHNNEPQYKRQGSTVIELDKDNYEFFLARGAVQPVKDEFDDVEDEEEASTDESAGAEETANAVANAGAEAAVNSNSGRNQQHRGGRR